MTTNLTVYTDDQIDLMRSMVCRDSTDDEFDLFLGQCERTGLDPFSKQIHAVKRWDGKQKREVMTVQVSIDGARLVAQRTKEYAGQNGPWWCGDDGVWLEDEKGRPLPWTGEGHPFAARVEVMRRGFDEPLEAIAHWDEYRQSFKDKKTGKWKLNTFWQNKPALMIAKCAEMLALRKAFPQELSGLYSDEEMSQADGGAALSPHKMLEAGKDREELAARLEGMEEPAAAYLIQKEWLGKGETLDDLGDDYVTQCLKFIDDLIDNIAEFSRKNVPLNEIPEEDIPW